MSTESDTPDWWETSPNCYKTNLERKLTATQKRLEKAEELLDMLNELAKDHIYKYLIGDSIRESVEQFLEEKESGL